jgi:hypothetical protein
MARAWHDFDSVDSSRQLETAWWAHVYEVVRMQSAVKWNLNVILHRIRNVSNFRVLHGLM